MAKKVAVLVVNPVNGSGLFQYLETFFENGIPFRTFAVADTTNVKTNSGLRLQTDDIIASLKGHEHEYDALLPFGIPNSILFTVYLLIVLLYQ